MPAIRKLDRRGRSVQRDEECSKIPWECDPSTAHAKRKTVTVMDVVYALKRQAIQKRIAFSAILDCSLIYSSVYPIKSDDHYLSTDIKFLCKWAYKKILFHSSN